MCFFKKLHKYIKASNLPLSPQSLNFIFPSKVCQSLGQKFWMISNYEKLQPNTSQQMFEQEVFHAWHDQSTIPVLGAEGRSWVQGQLRLHTENMAQNKMKKNIFTSQQYYLFFGYDIYISSQTLLNTVMHYVISTWSCRCKILKIMLSLKALCCVFSGFPAQ